MLLRFAILTGLLSLVVIAIDGCSEASCGVRVSKCMLIKSCNCSMTPEDISLKNCSCCHDCIQCLGKYFDDCCSCVGLCEPPKDMDPRLTMKSYVEELDPDEDQRALFDLVTADDMLSSGSGPMELMWTVESFPALSDTSWVTLDFPPEKSDALEMWKDVNCTVAFVKHCQAQEKCREACDSMGASSYRWFHTGCCQCNGATCINYGSREAKCTACLDRKSGKTEHKHAVEL